MALIVSLLVATLPFAVGVAVYNRLVRLRNRIANAFAQIDVQLKRRHDLIPGLVEVAKKYLEHEKTTLESVIEARAAAVSGLTAAAVDPSDAAAMKRLSQAENTLSGALSRLMAVSEDYPDLKADATMRQLAEELTSTENRVAFSRQAYNDSVLTYNDACQTFPSSLIAEAFKFLTAEPFRIDLAEQREAPGVAFA